MLENDVQNYKNKMNSLLNLNFSNLCVLTVDMQNEYLDKKHGTSPLAKDDIKNIINKLNNMIFGQIWSERQRFRQRYNLAMFEKFSTKLHCHFLNRRFSFV